jgi:hypothetical protein
MTINKIIEELRQSNPEPHGQTNGVKYKMEGQELEDYYAESAKSIFAENQKKAELEAKAAEKASLLDRLGITIEEAKLLLG